MRRCRRRGPRKSPVCSNAAGWLPACRFLLEAGYSARSGDAHQQLIDDLLALPRLGIDAQVESRVLDAQRQLARAGYHRLPPVDLMMASIADAHQLGILHYDGDYDLIAGKTDLEFQSVWLVERGSL